MDDLLPQFLQRSPRRRRKALIAVDSFKGSLTSMQAGRAIAEGIGRAWPDAECIVRPMADGGEGTLEALCEGMGGEFIYHHVTGPMHERVPAKYALAGDTAVVEIAQAAGLALVDSGKRNPLEATTYGVGELILDAARRGAGKFIVGLGGSATNDGGRGMLEALGLVSPQTSDLKPQTSGCKPDFDPSKFEFKVACDVKNPLCGPDGASAVFGPQKGATPEMVKTLDARLRAFADSVGDPATTPGDGAAGGLGFAFRRFLGAELTPGVDLVMDATRLDEYMLDADIVVTGEGRIDAQTAMGKAPVGVARMAKNHRKPVIAFAGSIGSGARAVLDCGIDAYFPIVHKPCTLEEALEYGNARRNLSLAAEQVFRALAARP